jgi:hypothetical protein
MYSPEAQVQIENEMKRAEAARASGNEGQARVCARRAAGHAIRAWLRYHQQTTAATLATDLIEQIRTQSGLPEEIHQVAEHLLLRVTPEFTLPVQVDLLFETRWLIRTLETTPFPSNDQPSLNF